MCQTHQAADHAHHQVHGVHPRALLPFTYPQHHTRAMNLQVLEVTVSVQGNATLDWQMALPQAKLVNFIYILQHSYVKQKCPLLIRGQVDRE